MNKLLIRWFVFSTFVVVICAVVAHNQLRANLWQSRRPAPIPHGHDQAAPAAAWRQGSRRRYRGGCEEGGRAIP